MLVDAIKITVVLGAAFSTDCAEPDAFRLLVDAPLCDRGTLDPTELAVEKDLSVEDGVAGSTSVVGAVEFEVAVEKGTLWANSHSKLHGDHNIKHSFNATQCAYSDCFNI